MSILYDYLGDLFAEKGSEPGYSGVRCRFRASLPKKGSLRTADYRRRPYYPYRKKKAYASRLALEAII